MRLFHYISDIHLEKSRTVFPTFTSSVTKHVPLLLAGDIGNPKKEHYYDFLREASKRYNRVFIVAGNHEYSRAREPGEVVARMQRLSDLFDNVTYLNRKCVEHEGVLIAGCTLWTPSTYSKGYIEDIHFLHKSIARANADCKRLVVMTHHLPTVKLIRKQYLKGRYNVKNWASNSDNILTPSISAWICGHTHDTINKNIAGVRFLVNSEKGMILEHSFH